MGQYNIEVIPDEDIDNMIKDTPVEDSLPPMEEEEESEEMKLKIVPLPGGGERIIRRRKRKSYDQLNYLMEVYEEHPEWTKEIM